MAGQECFEQNVNIDRTANKKKGVDKQKKIQYDQLGVVSETDH
jgi:hypothetical protein